MIRASISRLTTGVGSGAAALEIIAGATKGFWLRQIDLTLAVATASVYQVGRPAVKGITPTTPVLLMVEESADPTTSQAGSALAWATPPTVPTQFYQGAALPAAIGASVVFTFERLWVPATTSIVLWNGAANGAAYVNVLIDEANS